MSLPVAVLAEKTVWGNQLLPSADVSTVIVSDGVVPDTAVMSSRTLASRNSAAAEFREANVLLDITAVSGTTPSLTITVETSADGSSWFPHTVFSAKTATGKDIQKLANLGSYLRVSYAISGT